MKSILASLLLLLYCAAQAQQKKDTVYLGAQEVKELLTKNNYTSVPANDLDEMLDRKIAREVSDRFSSSLAIIGSILGIAAALFGGYIASRQKERIKSMSTDLEKSIKAECDTNISGRFGDYREAVDQRLQLMTENMSDKVNLRINDYFNKNFKEMMALELQKIHEQHQKTMAIQNEFAQQSNEMLKMYTEIKFERLKQNVIDQKDMQATFNELKTVLKQAEKIQDSSLMARTLDELSYAGFTLKKDEEVERILNQYLSKPDININVTTLVNTALGTLYGYQSTGDVALRQKTLDYLNKALRKLDDYGEALGLKLELFMVDHELATSEADREKAKQQASSIIDHINASSSVAATETIQRFDRVQASTAKSKYIELLYRLFPEAMDRMRQQAKATNPKMPALFQ